MAATNPLTSRSLLAQAPYPTPRLPSSLRLRPRLSLSNPNQPTTAPKRRRAPAQTHPAFSRRRANKKIPIPVPGEQPGDGVVVTDRGLAYRLDGAPFEFQYSYTEAPRARPVALREAPFLPFGPEATPRPWTGRKPLPKSRKELPEFDSFVLPPHGKKGVKPVQSPGPFLAGMEPRYQAASREEVLGEPLTKAEVAELVQGNLKTRRMLSMGRDGLTHNMLENIHAHWKRKRVCKIKCKGVCTVDMDNVCQQLEDKIGGKVIHRKGGVIFLFRGRNYNHRTRPCFPLMLWKPAAPVYPRLIKIPDGLTPQEATDMRNRGRQLPPICKLGKNGVYVNLVKQVREAFEACDLVRVDCSGLHKSDCRKIGAKLKDLVPCTLLSFEFEHILMLRGNEWKSSLPPLEENNFEVASDQQLFTGKENLNNEVIDSASALTSSEVVNNVTSLQNCNLGASEEKLKDSIKPNVENDTMLSSASANTGVCKSVGVVESESSAATPFEFSPLNPVNDLLEPSEKSALFDQSIQSGKSENGELVEQSPDGCGTSEQSPSDEVVVFPRPMGSSVEIGELETVGRRNSELIKVTDDANSDSTVSSSCMEGVLLLLKQAVDSGSALVLNENEFADADAVYQKSVAFTKTAPRGPVFPRKPRAKKVEPAKYVRINKHDLVENKEPGDVEKKDKVIRGSGKPQRKDDAQDFLSDVVPRGTLRVDELAKLLS